MPSIYSYQKHIDSQVTREIKLPTDPATHETIGTVLATVGSVTYVSLPDGATLPADQPAEIAASIQLVTLTDAPTTEIKAASPHCRLIAQRVQDRIRETYSIEDELYIARIAVGALRGTYTLEPGEGALIDAYQTAVEDARAWGRTQRAALGL